MSVFTNPNRIPENYGLRIAGGLIAFFLLMKILGLSNHVELRMLNLLILAVGIYFALKKFKQTHHDHLNYFRALVTGVGAGAVGTLIFSVVLFLFMQFDPNMMNDIKENSEMGRYLNPYIAAFVVAFEGFFSGFLVTFILINYINTDDVADPVDKEL